MFAVQELQILLILLESLRAKLGTGLKSVSLWVAARASSQMSTLSVEQVDLLASVDICAYQLSHALLILVACRRIPYLKGVQALAA